MFIIILCPINNKLAVIHLEKNEDGLLIPSKLFPKRLGHDIMIYFYDRDEDN